MDERILKLKKEGLTLQEIALELGLTYDKVRWGWRKLKQSGGTAGTKEPSPLPPSPLPVQPVRVSLPSVPKCKPKKTETYTSLHYGDVHYPFQDERALGVLYAVMKELQPDLIVNHGDLLDCYAISSFAKDPHQRVSLQQEIEQAAKHLATVSALVPHAERWLIEGNHEDRLRRTIWKMADSLPSRELIVLPGVREALSWPSLLGLGELGWEWVEGKRILHDRLVLKHGSVVRKWSAYTAKSEHEKYGKGGISGHSHRQGVFMHRDISGTDGWWETGCLCSLEPDYMEDPDWQQGFVVVTWRKDRSLYGVEQVHIHEGQALFRGKLYG